MWMMADIDHGDVTSANPADYDPYAWARAVPKVSPIIHIKQSPDGQGRAPAVHRRLQRAGQHPARAAARGLRRGRRAGQRDLPRALVQGARAERPRGDPADRRERRLLGAVDRHRRRATSRPERWRTMPPRRRTGEADGARRGDGGPGELARDTGGLAALCRRADPGGGRRAAGHSVGQGAPADRPRRRRRRGQGDASTATSSSASTSRGGSSARFGLDFCEVAPDLGEVGLPLRALGVAGASYPPARDRARRAPGDRPRPRADAGRGGAAAAAARRRAGCASSRCSAG